MLWGAKSSDFTWGPQFPTFTHRLQTGIKRMAALLSQAGSPDRNSPWPGQTCSLSVIATLWHWKPYPNMELNFFSNFHTLETFSSHWTLRVLRELWIHSCWCSLWIGGRVVWQTLPMLSLLIFLSLFLIVTLLFNRVSLRTTRYWVLVKNQWHSKTLIIVIWWWNKFYKSSARKVNDPCIGKKLFIDKHYQKQVKIKWAQVGFL